MKEGADVVGGGKALLWSVLGLLPWGLWRGPADLSAALGRKERDGFYSLPRAGHHQKRCEGPEASPLGPRGEGLVSSSCQCQEECLALVYGWLPGKLLVVVLGGSGKGSVTPVPLDWCVRS